MKSVPGLDLQAIALQADVDDVRTADQDRMRQPFLQHHLRGAQHALVLAVGIDDALGAGRLGGREDRLHHQPRAEHEAGQAVDVGRPVLDRPRCDLGFASGLGDGRRNAQDQPGIERRGDQEIGPEHRRLAGIGARRDVRRLLAGECGDGAHRRHLHLLVDGARTAVERPAEDVGKAQHVVDLVREIRAAGADHRVGPRRARHLRHDLRVRIGERQDQRLCRHMGEQFRLQHAGRRQAEEDVGAVDHIGQRTRLGVLDVRVLPAVHLVDAALVGDAEAVGDPDVLVPGAQRHQQIEAGKCRGAGARRHDLDVADRLAGELQRVEHSRRHDDRRAVLVVVEHRDAHPGLQPLLDLKTFRRLDVLEVDAAEGRLERRDRLDHAVDFRRVDLDVEHVDAGEFLEQHRLALHHRLGGERADIAEAEHGRAVGDDADQIGAAGVVGGGVRIVMDGEARRRHARRIGERQVALVAERLGRLDLQLSGNREFVEIQRRLVEIGQLRLLGVSVHECPSCPISFQSQCIVRASSSVRQNALVYSPPSTGMFWPVR